VPLMQPAVGWKAVVEELADEKLVGGVVTDEEGALVPSVVAVGAAWVAGFVCALPGVLVLAGLVLWPLHPHAMPAVASKAAHLHMDICAMLAGPRLGRRS
jgi:hypothetical protein